jgi:iron complex outermembrane receptor protein
LIALNPARLQTTIKKPPGMTLRNLFVLALTLTCACCSLRAQDSVCYRISQPVLVTATRLSSGGVTDPVPEQVIERGQLENMPAIALPEVLAVTAGMNARFYGADGGLRTVSLRGLGPEYTVITLNGVRLNDAQNGVVNTSALRLAGIDRVSVLRGGCSSLYGTDALGGVVAITTGAGLSPLELTLGAGSFGTRILEGSAGTRLGGLVLRSTIWYDEARNDYSFTSRLYAQPVKTVRANSGSIASGLRLEFTGSGASVLSGFVQLTRLDAGTPGAYLKSEQGKARQEDREILAGGTWRLPVAGGVLSITPSLRWTGSKYSDPGLVVGGAATNSLFENTQAACTALYETQVSSRVRGVLGMDIAYSRLAADGVNGNPDRMQPGVFFSADIRPLASDRLHVHPSLRFDAAFDMNENKSQYAVTPGLGASCEMVPEVLWLRAHAGFGFRLPTFNQLFWNPGGNPSLSPERSFACDAGITLQAGEHWPSIELGVFRHYITDKIVWAPGQGQIWRPTNVSEVLSEGLEAAVHGCLADGVVCYRLNGQWISARKMNSSFAGDLTSGKDLVYVPALSGSGTIAVTPVPFLSFSVIEQFMGERYTTETNDATLPAHAVTDAAVVLTVRPTGMPVMRFKFEALNLFDLEYEMVAYFPMPGRAYRFSITTIL